MRPAHQLIIEVCVLFLILPLAINALPFTRGVFIFIWMGAVLCYLLLHRDASFERRQLWHWEQVNRANLTPILGRFVIGALGMVAIVWFTHSERLFAMPLERPGTWLLIMLAYPLLSVYPQEVIFRAFFIHRYHILFKHREWLFISNALVFGFAHILFNHWLTMVLSALGGYLFSRTYYSSRSLALACIEHSLYGCWIFTAGLGMYFYSGAMR